MNIFSESKELGFFMLIEFRKNRLSWRAALFSIIASFLICIFSAQKLNAASEIIEDFTSPVTTDAKWVLLGGTIATVGVLALHNDVDDRIQRNFSRNKPLGKYSKYGDLAGQVIPNAAYAVGMALDGLIGHHDESMNNALLMTKSTAYSALVTTALKYSVREPRPNDSNNRVSFPSGHATTAFAFASTVAAIHEWYWGIPAYALGVFVGLSRINDNQHWLHDVLAGATIGTSYGLGTYYRKTGKGLSTATSFEFVPIDAFSGFAMNYSCSW